MGTHLINAIQHRNGPNQRPPNSIFGNAGNNQQLLSNHLICGTLGAICCGVVLITYLNYTLKLKGPDNGKAIFAVLSIAILIIILLLACVCLMCQKRKKRIVIVYLEPSGPELETDISVLAADASNAKTSEGLPSYDHAVKMPPTDRKPSYVFPPSYDNIDLV